MLDLSFGVRFDDAEEAAFEFVELAHRPLRACSAPPDSPFRDFESVSLAALDGIDMIAAEHRQHVLRTRSRRLASARARRRTSCSAPTTT